MSGLPRGWSFKRERKVNADGTAEITVLAIFQAVRLTTLEDLNKALEKHCARSESDAAIIRAEFHRNVEAAQVLNRKTSAQVPAPVAAKPSKAKTATKSTTSEIVSTKTSTSKAITTGKAARKAPAKSAAKPSANPLSKTPPVKPPATPTGRPVGRPPGTAASKAAAKPTAKTAKRKSADDAESPAGKRPKTEASKPVVAKKAPGGKKRPIQPAPPVTAAISSSNDTTSAATSSTVDIVGTTGSTDATAAGERSKSSKAAGTKTQRGAFSYPTANEFKFFRTVFAPIADPFVKSRDELLHCYYEGEKYVEWLSLLDLNQSLYLHGLGDKGKLLKGFVNKCLTGEDVIELCCGIDRMNPSSSHSAGRQPSWNSVILNLLKTIADEVLATPLPVTTTASSRTSGRVTKVEKHVSSSESYSLLSAATVDFSAAAVAAMLADEGVSLVHKASVVADALLVYHGYKAHGYKARVNDADVADIANDPSSLPVISYNRPSKLYIVITDTPSGYGGAGGPGSVQSREKARAEKITFMRCLSILASSKAVGLVVTSCSVNTISQACDLDTLRLFNWAYVHCPTFENKPTELCLQDFGVNFASYSAQHKDVILSGEAEVAGSLHSNLKFVINSLTRKHKDILRVLCEYIQKEENERKLNKAKSGSTSSVITMPWTRFVSACVDNLIVKGDPDIRYLMRELIDHKLVAQATDAADGLKSVSVQCPVDTMMALL